MINDDLIFYNNYFDEKVGFVIQEKFYFDSEAKSYQGKVLFTKKKLSIELQIKIPQNYPFEDLRFYCNSIKGLPHQNYDGSICLNTPFVNHLYTRLEYDTNKLKSWIFDYIENNKSDADYEYSPVEYGGKVNFLFQEDLEVNLDRFEKEKCGIMTYSILNTHSINGKFERLSAICQSIGGNDVAWSNHYKNRDKYNGIWVFMEQEPVLKRKERILNWKDLIPLLPEDFFISFETFCKKMASYKLGAKYFNKEIFIALGYYIPSKKGKELNWDLILLPRKNFPRKSNNIMGSLKKYNKEIQWEQTYNSSYTRFFGRGSFSNKITHSKILVLGVGAIGSSICETLVRGGTTNLTINDIDKIEHGNICRSTYFFTEIGSAKVAELKERLHKISPFAEVNITNKITPLSPFSEDYKKLKSELEQYDYIFDCSANNGLIQMLSDMKLECNVLYISITNKAKEMICISNSDCENMMERRNQLLFSLGGFSQPEFREGTGCWHPTFEASFSDINQLLHFNLKKINTWLNLNLPLKSFYSFFENGIIDSSEDVCYIQEELGLSLRIESHCFDIIHELVWQHYPNEFGGIFIGNYIDDFKEVVISDILYPDDYSNSPTQFTPNPDDLNNKLAVIRNKFDDHLTYIGDWHSHPNYNNNYSKPDYQSIKTIAKSPYVNTHNPLLMIVAFGEDYFDPGFYVFEEDKLYKYKKLK